MQIVKVAGKSRIMSRQKAINISDEMLEEAASWHARVSDELTGEETWLAFTEWLEADPARAAAYDRVEDLSMEVEGMAEPALDLMSTRAEKAGTEVAGDNVIHAAWRWKNRNVWGSIAAAAAVVMIAIANMGVFTTPEVVVQEYFTGFGEQQMVRLEDGSTVHLNMNSRIEVRMEADARRTTLAYGEAVFSVAKNKDRPFFVSAGDRQVRVVGTKFNVLRHAGTVTVTVAEGIVDVSPDAGASGHKTERLTAGKQLVHAEGAKDSVVREVNAETYLSWESGILEYEDTPLSHTISELSRYFDRPIQVEGDISHITFSGVLNVRDQEAVLQLLEETLPITISRSNEMIIVVANK